MILLVAYKFTQRCRFERILSLLNANPGDIGSKNGQRNRTGLGTELNVVAVPARQADAIALGVDFKDSTWQSSDADSRFGQGPIEWVNPETSDQEAEIRQDAVHQATPPDQGGENGNWMDINLSQNCELSCFADDAGEEKIVLAFETCVQEERTRNES